MLPGWQNLMVELEDQLDLCTIDACNTLEELHFTKGRAAVIRMLLNYQDYITRLGRKMKITTSSSRNSPHPGAIAGEPMGHPLFQLSDTPLRNGDKHGNTD